MKILLMYNPNAGDEEFSLNATVSKLEGFGAEVVSQNTKEMETEIFSFDTFDFVIIAGGDGTVGEVVKKIVEKPVPFALLPIGSANNFANSMNTDTAISSIIQGWENRSFQNFKIGEVKIGNEKKLFLESVGWGLFEKVLSSKSNNTSKEEKGKVKVESGVKKMKSKLDHLKPTPYEIFLDDRDFSGDYLWIEIMNTQIMGPSLNIAPEAKPDDEYLDIVLIKQQEKEKLAQFLSEKNEKKSAKFFNSFQAKEIRIRTQEPMHTDSDVFPVDNRIMQPGEMVKISLFPQNLQVIKKN